MLNGRLRSNGPPMKEYLAMTQKKARANRLPCVKMHPKDLWTLTMIHKKNRNEIRMSRQAEKEELGDRLCDLG